MTAQTLDGTATLATIKAELAERVTALRERGVTPGLATVLVGDDPGNQWYVGAKHKDCAKIGIASLPPRPARHRDAGGGRGADRRAQRRPGRDRLPRPAAHRARRVPPAVARRPRQGRRRPAPLQPRQAGAGRGRAAALHAGRLPRAAAPPRRRDRRRRGRGGRPRAHRRAPARPAAHPPLGERHRHPLPHRHPRPGRARAQRRHRRRRGRRARDHHRRHGQARRRGARRRASPASTARSPATWPTTCGTPPAGCRPTPAAWAR